MKMLFSVYQNYQFYLQLLSNNSVQLYQYYDSSLDSRTFTPTLNTNEDIFVLGTIFYDNTK